MSPPPVKEGKAGKEPSSHSLLLVNLLLFQTHLLHFDHNFYLPLPRFYIFQSPSSKSPIGIKMFPSPYQVERQEKQPATATVIFCPCYSCRLLSSNPSISLFCMPMPLTAPTRLWRPCGCLQDGFQQCPHSSAGFSIAHLRLTLTWVSSCPFWIVTPASSVVPRWLLTMDGGRWRKSRDQRKENRWKSLLFYLFQ